MYLSVSPSVVLCRIMVAAVYLLLQDTSDLQAASREDGEMSAEPTGVLNADCLSWSELQIADDAEVFVAGMGDHQCQLST